jgi:hypothetical protein
MFHLVAGENTSGLGLIPLTVCRGGDLMGSIYVCGKPVASLLIIFWAVVRRGTARSGQQFGPKAFDKKIYMTL